MNNDLYTSYEKRKKAFDNYITHIKTNMAVDFFSISNVTLIRDPHNTTFAKNFFLENYYKKNKFFIFIKYSFKYYIKQFYFLISYFIGFGLFKIFYKKKPVNIEDHIMIDVFFLVDNITQENKFNEQYFKGLYEVLEEHNQSYIFLPRLVGINKNPFKLINFFKLINDDKRNFLFEFELLSIKNFISMFILILQYPFKTLRLLQKEKSGDDILFNNELIKDIESFNFETFSRYILGENIANIDRLSKVYSWSEFQAIERSFNFAIRKKNKNIKLFGCQFYLNFETYFSNKIDDIDVEQGTSFHHVLVNAKYYLLERKKVDYKIGVSLRYKNMFSFNKVLSKKDIILLGSHLEETKYTLNCLPDFDRVLFKSHPSINMKSFLNLSNKIIPVEDDIYTLFQNALIIITTASGTAVEAVACGIPVIIVASKNNLVGNPLVANGKGKVWDIAFSKDDVFRVYNELLEFKKYNIKELESIANWYKENFFVEPNEKNIKKVFEIGGN